MKLIKWGELNDDDDWYPYTIIGHWVYSYVNYGRREQENKGENNISNENKNEKEDSNNGK